MTTVGIIGEYLRVSDDDIDIGIHKTESYSISNQRSIVRDLKSKMKQLKMKVDQLHTKSWIIINNTKTEKFPIDTPVSGVSMEDRPLLTKLLEVPKYLELYHEYLQQIVDEYFNSGLFKQTVDLLNTLISSYVEKVSLTASYLPRAKG